MNTKARFRNFTAGLGLLSSAALIVGAPAPANAQDAEDSPEIIVTGSRVQRSGFETPVPVTVLEKADLESKATTNIANYLNDLPAFVPSSTPATVSLSPGGAGNFLNLRGLGPERTLILVDGRRHVPTTDRGTVSLNVIPEFMISRIETVTGGASAAYGSDAVAGVVNLIFDQSLQGFRGELQSGISEQGDNQEWRIALAYGTRFGGDRGHFSVAAEIMDNDGVRYQRDRDWGAQNWGVILNPAFTPGGGVPDKLLVPNTGLSIGTEGGLILSGSLAGQQFAPDGSLVPFNPGISRGGLVGQGGDGPYPGEYSALVVPLNAHSVFARGTYDLTDHVTVFVEGSYAQQEANNRNLATHFNFGDIVIAADNAFLSPEVKAQLATNGEPGFALSRLHTDFGFWQARSKVNTYRGVAGLRGRLDGDWNWDAYYQYGETDLANIEPGNIVVSKFRDAIDAVENPITGLPECRSGASGCIPLNLFGFGAPSQEALNYIQGTSRRDISVRQHVAAVSMRGRPFDTWAGPVSVAFGAEYRKDRVEAVVDAISQASGFALSNEKGVEGSIGVKEVFLEAMIPLLAESPIGKSVELDLAGRITDYSTSGSVKTWKAGISWALNNAIRFRATRSRDIRAPNIFELFSTGGTGFFPLTDPDTGVPSVVLSTLYPNPNLSPEKATTTVAGVVLKPGFMPGFRLSADYFDIKLNGVIGQLFPEEIVQRCNAGEDSLCELILRDSDGVITQVNRTQFNLSRRQLRGIDVEALYSLPLSDIGLASSGVLTFRLLGTYMLELSTDTGSVSIDQAGSLVGLPQARGYGSVRYSNGPLGIHLGGRFVGAAKRDNIDAPLTYDVDSFPAQLYLDASIQYSIVDRSLGEMQIFGNISNLLNKDPVITGRDLFFSAATNATYYDVVGRAYKVGVRFKF